MKQELKEWTLSIIAEAKNELILFLESVPKKERDIKGELKKWSTKDQVAHLTFWFEIFVKNIKAYHKGKSLISTKNYLLMNDKAWEKRKDLTWAEIEEGLIKSVKEIETEIKRLTIEQLADGNEFSVEPQRNPPRPLIKSLLYELIDHPFKHLVKMNAKLGNDKRARESLIRMSNALKQPGFSKWAGSSINKIRKFSETLS